MGFLSRIKNAVSGVVASAPGGSRLQSAIAKDPIAQTVMRYDPAAKELAEAHGLVAQKPAPAPAVVADEGQKTIMPTRRPAWQDDRVAALRARFSRLPASAPAAPPPAAGAGTVPPPVVATPPQPAAQVTMAAKPAVANPAARDVDAYSRAWGNGNNTY